MRSFFILLSKVTWAQRAITRSRLAWSAASRFIAGEKSADAIEAVRIINQKQILATLDHLGENVQSADDALRSSEEIIKLLDEIDQAQVLANVSIKLSQLGLVLDEEPCKMHLKMILEKARILDNFIRIDMEDSSLTEKTLEIYSWARDEGFENVGIVIQAYLFRSEKDIERLGRQGARVRLCKGAYSESAMIAFPAKEDVDQNYDRLAEALMESAERLHYPALSANGKIPPILAVATHDLKRIEFVKRRVSDHNFPQNALEFQLLYGIRRDLQESLSAEGFPVRVYIPYGTQWFPYFMRRLAERPANVWFFLKSAIQR